ncbi:MAG TPA: hypothetical protein VLE53_07290 [Gemmatimonadaceae bacterium]|nr:hypothetical protein [Gemmatimonadaceae bacterium]
MSQDRPAPREITTAELAAAAERAREPQAPDPEADPPHAGDREVAVPRDPARAVDRSPDASATPLFPRDVAEQLRARWSQVQTGFVDEPRRAVEEADSLVADTIKRLANSFAAARADLEREWDRGEDVSTEDLRQALQRYRAFFGRLLEV